MNGHYDTRRGGGRRRHTPENVSPTQPSRPVNHVEHSPGKAPDNHRLGGPIAGPPRRRVSQVRGAIGAGLGLALMEETQSTSGTGVS